MEQDQVDLCRGLCLHLDPIYPLDFQLEVRDLVEAYVDHYQPNAYHHAAQVRST